MVVKYCLSLFFSCFIFQNNLRNQFDFIGNHGVVAIYTKEDHDFKYETGVTNLLETHGGLPKVDFENIIQHQSQLETGKSPQLQPAIYWTSNAEVQSDGILEIRFRHGDNIGNFKIEVLGDHYASTSYLVE